jgi:hypothetical protein
MTKEQILNICGVYYDINNDRDIVVVDIIKDNFCISTLFAKLYKEEYVKKNFHKIIAQQFESFDDNILIEHRNAEEILELYYDKLVFSEKLFQPKDLLIPQNLLEKSTEYISLASKVISIKGN